MLLSNITTFLFTSLTQFAPVMSLNDQAQIFISPATKYEAKLICEGPPEEVVPGSFTVNLALGTL